jgi:hypothetical protein
MCLDWLELNCHGQLWFLHTPQCKGLGFLGQKRERGTASGSPPQVSVVYAVAASAGRCQGAHRKSGVVIRPSYACPVESYLLP